MRYGLLYTLDKDINDYCARTNVSPKTQNSIFNSLKLKMTEAGVDVIVQVRSELKGDSRLVVLLGSPEGAKRTSKKLSAQQGVKKIRRGVFVIHGFSESHAEILDLQSAISFIKTKEIPTIRMKAKDAYSSRGFAIVSFRFKNPTAQQKKLVERLIRKTTGIRLRPGVAIFPLLRSKERRRIIGSEDERVLLDSTEFNRLVREAGGDTTRWSRLKMINLNGDNHITQAIEQTLFRDLNALEEKTRALREQCKDSAVSIKQLKRAYTIQSRRFRELKSKWMLAKKLWHYDAEKALRRTYNILLSTRRVIISEEITRAS